MNKTSIISSTSLQTHAVTVIPASHEQLNDIANAVLLQISINEISEYELNPRREINSAYQAIKVSIQCQGILQPLTVTQRPGEVGYLVKNGGNTRLRIVKELFDETHDPRFATINCLVEPWTQESDVLTAHLIENEVRGDLTFIDKAISINNIKQLIEKELTITLSQRELALCLQKKGYRIDSPMLSRMEYTLSSLWPVIPNALTSGIGRPQINKIRALECAVLEFAKLRGTEPNSIRDLKQSFVQLLANYDDADWNIKPVVTGVVEWLSVLFEENINLTRLDLEAILAGRSPGPNAIPSYPLPDLRRKPSKTSASVLRKHVDASDKHTQLFECIKSKKTQTCQLNERDDKMNDKDSTSIESKQPATDCTNTWLIAPLGIEESEVGPLTEIDLHRKRIWELVNQLVDRAEMHELLIWCHCGPGYMLDLPDYRLVLDKPSQMNNERWVDAGIWWFLTSINEQFLIPGESFDQYLPDHAFLKEYVEAVANGADPQALLRSLVGDMRFEWMAGLFLWRLTDEDMNAVTGLIEISRTLHALCEKQKLISIWEL